MPSENSSSPSIAPLSNSNSPQWAMEMKAWLMTRGLWLLVSGEESSPGSTKVAELLDWKMRSLKAAGALFLAVEHEQRIHLAGIESYPLAIWTKLESVHVSKRPGARFNAYDDLFSIRKQPDESLQALMNRIDEAMRTISNLRPKDFTLAKLDEELVCMAMIRSLPDEYSHFTSSLLLFLSPPPLLLLYLLTDISHSS